MKKCNIVALWMPFPIEGASWCLDYFNEYFKDRGNISFVDLKSNIDGGAYEMMRAADLVVIGIPQDKYLLDTFFSLPDYKFESVCYVIMNYYGDYILNKEYVSKMYRIPLENIATMPRNVHIDSKDSNRRYFMLSGQNMLLREETSFFRDELSKIGKVIFRKICQE